MSRTPRTLLPLLAALLASLALAPEALADRRSSLGGNLLIHDQDDVLVFPHTALDHLRLITFDVAQDGAVGANGVTGNAGAILGDPGFAFGVYTHRFDQTEVLRHAYYSFGDIDVLGAPSPFSLSPKDDQGVILPLQWIDVVTAFEVGGNPLGIRLSLAYNDNSQENTNGDATNTTDNSAFGLNLVAGYGMKAGDLKLDLAAEISYGSQSFEDNPDGDNNDTLVDIDNLPTLALMARGTMPMAKGVDLGLVGLLDYSSTTRVNDPAGDESKSGYATNTLGLDVGAGPVYHVDKKFTVAAYGTVGLRLANHDPNINSDADNDQFSSFSLVLPQFRISGEYRVFDWLLLRSGAQYAYTFNFTDQEQGEDAVTSNSVTASGYRWIAGVGIDLDELQLNGTFNAPFLLNGPNFIGGGENMFAMLNVSYDFE